MNRLALKLSLIAGLAAPLLFSGCATPPPAPVVEETPPVAKPLPPIIETIVLLPTKDGKASGAVEIGVDGQKQVLDEPYETAMVATGEKIGTRFSNAEEVREIAGEALQSLPIKPASFTLLFAIDSDKLPADAEATIARIVAEIAKRQVPDVSIVGHTDRSGNAKANFALSQRRASNVHRRILDKGVKTDKVRIEVVGKGDSDNAVINPKRKFEQRNRRVEVFVR
jgi:outer membrane protein OmpA-like peptidoglycan-associated protein